MALATRPSLSPAEALHATPPKLSAVEPRAADLETMRAPRLRYDVVSRLLFALIALVYGRAGNLRKFRALEPLARVPYHAWEQATYRAAGRLSHRANLASTVHRCILQSRAQQDNEQWHLFVLDRVRFTSKLGDVFAHLDTVAGLLRQIGHDERVHKLESLHEAARAARRPTP